MHYTIAELEAKIAEWMLLGCIPLDGHEYLKALVDRANSAEDAQRRYEQAMGRMMAGAVVDLAEAGNDRQ